MYSTHSLLSRFPILYIVILYGSDCNYYIYFELVLILLYYAFIIFIKLLITANKRNMLLDIFVKVASSQVYSSMTAYLTLNKWSNWNDIVLYTAVFFSNFYNLYLKSAFKVCFLFVLFSTPCILNKEIWVFTFKNIAEYCSLSFNNEYCWTSFILHLNSTDRGTANVFKLTVSFWLERKIHLIKTYFIDRCKKESK